MAAATRWMAVVAALLGITALTAAQSTTPAFDSGLLAGGRRIAFVRSFSSEKDISPKRSLWSRLVDIVAGPRTWHVLVRPYGITTDSRGRILVTDPGISLVHIFDFGARKYSRLEGSRRERFQSPIGVAVDAQDNIYVTDSRLGKVFVFDARGKSLRVLGDAGGEGYFKRPTGIAIDRRNQVIYLSDTLRHRIYLLDLQGKVLRGFGSRGSEPGQFNFPTDLALQGDDLLVVDAMNFRIQVLDRQGSVRRVFGKVGDSSGTLNRAKGVAVDSESNIYVVDALFETVQVFDHDGRLLYYFGQTGSATGEFVLPSGLWIDAQDRAYVVDSYNRRVQVFQFTAAPRTPSAGSQ